MPHPKPRTALIPELRKAAAQYQADQVIPHCPSCAKPCCKLDALVLELDWQQVRTLWKLNISRHAFDRQLEAGQGPQEIRAGNGLYYAHQKTCPAYDEVARTCRVYNQPSKPPGCSDFPVYADGDSLIADLRCEAVSLEEVLEFLTRALGPDVQFKSRADRDFPFLVTVSAHTVRSDRTPGKARQRAEQRRT